MLYKTGMKLTDLREGESGTIVSITNDLVSQKLMEMGCLPGESLKIAKISPQGNNIVVHVFDYTLALRRKEAAAIQIERQ